jgi:protein-S-isoprenylcysteine O-methyltransferase Ste14
LSTTTRTSARQSTTWISAALVVLGVILAVVAVLYFAQPAHSLPSFFPGHTAHGNKARTKHGIAAAVVAAIVLALGAWVAVKSKRRT